MLAPLGTHFGIVPTSGSQHDVGCDEYSMRTSEKSKMDRTVGNSGQPRGASVSPAELVSCLNWIHAHFSSADVMGILSEISRDILGGRSPRLAVKSDVEPSQNESGFQAAAYFRIMPGRVAGLGGIRVLPGYEAVGASQLSGLSDELRAEGLRQVQAVVQPSDRTTQTMLDSSGFGQLASVRQMCLDLHQDVVVCKPQAHVCWQRATDLSRLELASLIDSTFVGTLDCPQLNQVRAPGDVLDGFLDGHALEQAAKHWQLLTFQGNLAGCVCVGSPRDDLAELTYMGLCSQFRRRGLGSVLIEKAASIAKDFGVRWMVLAVDEANLPAMRAYQRYRFVPYAQKLVYLRDFELGIQIPAA